MNSCKRIILALATLALSGGLAVASGATAIATPVSPTPAVASADAGAVAPFASKCKVWEKTANRFSGWCDGRGPASYRATITCTSGGEHQGQWRWLGDRRGSTAWCDPGHFRVASKFQFQS